MIRLLLSFVLLTVLVVPQADAAKSKKSKKQNKASATASKGDRPFGKPDLGTNHMFTALDVNGRYQYPAEAGVTVEDEKGLTDLLGVRRHFKDRLAVEETRN